MLSEESASLRNELTNLQVNKFNQITQNLMVLGKESLNLKNDLAKMQIILENK